MHTNLGILIEKSVKIRMEKKVRVVICLCVTNGEFYFSTADQFLTKTVNYPAQFHADFLSSLCYDALLLRLALSHIAFLNRLKYRSEKRYHIL